MKTWMHWTYQKVNAWCNGSLCPELSYTTPIRIFRPRATRNEKYNNNNKKNEEKNNNKKSQLAKQHTLNLEGTQRCGLFCFVLFNATVQSQLIYGRAAQNTWNTNVSIAYHPVLVLACLLAPLALVYIVCIRCCVLPDSLLYRIVISGRQFTLVRFNFSLRIVCLARALLISVRNTQRLSVSKWLCESRTQTNTYGLLRHRHVTRIHGTLTNRLLQFNDELRVFSCGSVGNLYCFQFLFYGTEKIEFLRNIKSRPKLLQSATVSR